MRIASLERTPSRAHDKPEKNRPRAHASFSREHIAAGILDDEDYDRQRRRRYEEPVPVTVRKMLIGIAESAVRRVEDDVYQVAKMISENSEDEEIKDLYTRVSVQLAIEQPLKIPFIAAIILTLNTMKPELVSEFLQHAKNVTQSYIDRGMWRELKLLFRLLGCLQSLFEGDGIFPLLEALFSRSVDLQTASSEDSLGLELVKTILFTIPYVMASSAEGLEDQAAALLDKTDIIASTPHTLETLVSPFPTDDDADAARLSVIGLLQKQLQEEAKNGWDLACLPRPWLIATARIESERAQKREARQQEADYEATEHQTEDVGDSPSPARKHAFPKINVPDPVSNGPRAIFPEVYFSVYLEQDIETVPPLTDIASSLIRDALVDTINLLDFNRIVAAKALIDVDCYFTPRTFMKRAVPYDKLREVVTESDSSTWKPEDAAIDAVFSQLFQLPTPEHKFVYYHSVLTESCKLAPAAVAPSLGRAIRYLYRSSPRMDLALSYRFLDWFSHHLSNFGFTWKWTEWTDDLELPDVHPKKAFIIGAIDKEIRLSFAQRIKGTLPIPYRYLITDGKEKDTPDFKYEND
ncbi:serine/threonine protein kinase, partial [Ascosphaera pollenicola]